MDEIRDFWGEIVASADDVEELAECEAQSDLLSAREYAQEGVTVDEVIAHGDPAEQIILAAQEHAINLIVMASHGRGALGRWTFGSVADRVSRHSTVPVLIVRPELVCGQLPEITRIVVPFDGSTVAAQAVPVAGRIAHRRGCAVHLVDVVNPASTYYPAIAVSGRMPDEVYTELLEKERTAAEAAMSAAAAPLRAEGIEVTTQVQSGSVVPAIEAALRAGDLVVLTSHGRSGVTRWFLGSVAERLIRDGRAPVLLVPAAERVASERPATATLAVA